eukprot:snap_masked-scaffold_52-processed-gene-1.66-mRNA-1 protein AED:1.00 eAED:1.00 QI:0/0/0/0/1/1/2/0/72
MQNQRSRLNLDSNARSDILFPPCIYVSRVSYEYLLSIARSNTSEQLPNNTKDSSTLELTFIVDDYKKVDETG